MAKGSCRLARQKQLGPFEGDRKFFAAGSKLKGSCRYRSLLANDSASYRQKNYPPTGVAAHPLQVFGQGEVCFGNGEKIKSGSTAGGFIRLRLNTLQLGCRDDWSSPGATTQLKKAGVNRADLSRRSFDEGGSSPERMRVRLRRNSALIPRSLLRGASFTQLVLSYGLVMIFQIGGKLMRGVPL